MNICLHLNACAAIGSLDIGETIYDKLREQGLLKDNIVLGNALIDMYTKCGVLQKAQKVFDELPQRDIVSWNVLIAGYVEHGLGDQAIKCFRQMDDEGIISDDITYTCILNACAAIMCLEIGGRNVCQGEQARIIKGKCRAWNCINQYVCKKFGP